MYGHIFIDYCGKYKQFIVKKRWWYEDIRATTLTINYISVWKWGDITSQSGY